MYKQQRDARLGSKSIGKPIRGSGWFDVGVYDIATTVEVLDDNLLSFTFKDVTGNTHNEQWKLSDGSGGLGYEWRRFRAAMLPHLQCQKMLDELTPRQIAKAITGTTGAIKIELTSGYKIIKDRGEYCAVDENSNQLFPWSSNLDKVRAQCIKAGHYRSLHKIADIDGDVSSNVAKFLKKVGGEG